MMTTNHIEKLDPALLRDGRVDIREEIPYSTNREIKAYFDLFYEENATFAGNFSLPIATIQEICIRNPKDSIKAKEEIEKLHI